MSDLIKQTLFLLRNPLGYPEFSYSLQTAIPWYINKRSNKENINSKYYWYQVFKKLNISQPKTYALVDNKKIIKQFHQINLNNPKNIIIKPDDSGWGRGIVAFKNLSQINELSILQEKIQNNNDYFRIISSNNKLIDVFYYFSSNRDTTEINLNPNNNKETIKCLLDTNTLNVIHPKTNKIIKKLDIRYKLNLNKAINASYKINKFLKHPKIVCYDVIINYYDYYFLEGNIPVAVYGTKFRDYFKLINKVKPLIYN